MDKRKRYSHAKPVIVRFKHLHGNDDTGQCETSSQYSESLPLDRQLLMASVNNYIRNGVLLLDIEESDLQNITTRVAEQMVSDKVIETFDINDIHNVFLLMEHPAVKECTSLEEHKFNGIHRKDTEIIDIRKLSCSNGNYTKNLQREFNHQIQETSLVVVANADFILKPAISFVRLEHPVHFPQTLDFELQVRFLFVLLGPATQIHPTYLDVGNALWTVLSDDEFCHEACSVKTKDDLIIGIENVLANEQHKEINYVDEEHSNLLRKKDIDQRIPAFNSLLRTNRLWGGLINDVTRRLPHYKSDFCDGLNRQVIAASIFLYFGVLSTAITFGGLISSKTDNLMGISETLLATSLVGILFHLMSSQPLLIVGGTGPLLLFDEALFQLCQFYNIDFLTIRIYIGIWLGLIAVTVAAFDGCVYLRLLTRFTQELFASLISLIFIMESVFKVIDVFKTHPISVGSYDTNSSESYFHETDNVTSETIDSPDIYEPNTALFCAILSIGTFVLAYCLRLLRNSHFLGRGIRRAIGDFGVPISISVFVYLSYLVPQIHTEKLIVPEGLSPTDSNSRSWIIPFDGLPIWVPFISVTAALLVYVLIFMETQISELILDSRGFKKGSGFHVDIVIICMVNVVFGFLGMPWQSGATIRSVTHVSAVTTIQRSKESCESQQLVVKEQRVSGLIISVCVGLSIILAPMLRNIPVSILYGVFFYMGIVSLSGIQFVHRIRLLFTPTKYHGTEAYVQQVPTRKMHIYTCGQALALCALWIVKSSRFALALPFVLLLMIPLKQKVATYYSATEMAALDGNLPDVNITDEPDFYEQTHLPV